jgi:hypothetical protein
MKRSAKSVAKSRQFEADLDAVTPDLIKRSGGQCEARIVMVCGSGMSIAHRHHKLPRSNPACTNDLDNLLYVCQACHSWIHGHPKEAYALGLLRRSTSAPNYTPISAGDK